MVLEKSSREGNSLGIRDGGQGAKLFHLEDPCFQGFGLFPTEGRWSIRLDTRLGRGCGCCRRARDGHDLLLLLLEFVLLVDNLLSEVGQFCLQNRQGVALVLGHVVLGFFLWGFLDRAPRSWVLGSSKVKVTQLSSKSG